MGLPGRWAYLSRRWKLLQPCLFGSNTGAPCSRCSGGERRARRATPTRIAQGTCTADNAVCNVGSSTCSNDASNTCTSAECVARSNVCSNRDQGCVFSSDCPPGGVCGGGRNLRSGPLCDPRCVRRRCLQLDHGSLHARHRPRRMHRRRRNVPRPGHGLRPELLSRSRLAAGPGPMTVRMPSFTGFLR